MGQNLLKLRIQTLQSEPNPNVSNSRAFWPWTTWSYWIEVILWFGRNLKAWTEVPERKQEVLWKGCFWQAEQVFSWRRWSDEMKRLGHEEVVDALKLMLRQDEGVGFFLTASTRDHHFTNQNGATLLLTLRLVHRRIEQS